MWIPLPEGLASFLQMVGFEWPEADEEKLWDCGDAWGTFAADLRDLTTQADRAVRRVLDDNSDDSIQAFGERWEYFTKEPGYLRDAADAAELAQNAFYACSIIVISLKILVIAQLIYLAYVWAQAAATAVESLGASLFVAAATTVAVRIAVKLALKLAMKALKELAEKVLKEAREKVARQIERLRNLRRTPPGKKPRPPRGGRPVPRSRDDAEEILDDGAVIEKEGKGQSHSKIAVRTGGSAQAESDFAELTEGLQVKTYPNGTKVATLPDGTSVSLRSSSDGRTTISLQQKGQPATKYRYDP